MNGESILRSSSKLKWKVVLFNQYNLALLGCAAAYALALRATWPLLLFAGLEVLWWLFALISAGVRRWAARYAMNQQQQARLAKAEPLLRELDAAYAARVERLEQVGTELRRLLWERGLEAALLDVNDDSRLEAVLLAFTRMAGLHQRLSRFGQQANLAQLEEEIMGLGQSLASEQDAPVRFVLSQALGVAQGRLEQQEGMQGQLRVLGVKMGTLEMALDYLRSRVFGSNNDRELALEVAQTIANIQMLSESEGEVIVAASSPPITRVTATRSVQGL